MRVTDIRHVSPHGSLRGSSVSDYQSAPSSIPAPAPRGGQVAWAPGGVERPAPMPAATPPAAAQTWGAAPPRSHAVPPGTASPPAQASPPPAAPNVEPRPPSALSARPSGPGTAAGPGPAGGRAGAPTGRRLGMGDALGENDLDLEAALRAMIGMGASDLHVTTGAPPTVRMDGRLRPLENFPTVYADQIQRALYAILTQRQREEFEEKLELDFAHAVRGVARFRVNLYQQRDSLGAAFRVIPYEIKPLEELGVPPVVANFAGLPRGLVLVTGPTGSGKSTTLYATLEAVNDGEDKIITVEDPVEYNVPGISQIQVHAEIGYTFARALRAILRQDPDTIMIGEIRDGETAEIAVQAALTGHMVFSTLHTNDALGAFTRLIDMGIEPFLVVSSVRAVVAQRLIRLVCRGCVEPETPSPEAERTITDLATRFPGLLRGAAKWSRGAGCKACQGTGYKGRMAIYEMAGVTADLHDAILTRAPTQDLARIAARHGYRTLREDGLIKAWRGDTSLEEVLRVTGLGE